MPQSAFFSAGASLTPSPVMPTIWPRCCSTSTMWYLCSGNTWAKPSAFSMDSADCAVSSLFVVAQAGGIENVGAQTDLVLAVSLAMASASPVTILTLTPICACGGDGCCSVARAADRTSGNTPTNCHPPSPSARATPKRAEAPRGEIVDGLIDGGLDLRGVGGQRQDDLRGALGDLELVPSAPVTVASVRLCTGSKGWK